MSGSLESAEHQYKTILEGFFLSKYDERTLPSHGIGHHRRVWKYAKDLAPVLAAHHGSEKPANSASLLIACYLHDIGMSVEPGIRHGAYSAELCMEFLAKNNLSEKDFPGLIQAILNHDNKDYNSNTINGDLFTLLSIADDLDAFGYVGIYRYLEIYLQRGIDSVNIGSAIRSNALKRFSHFEKIFSFNKDIVEKHKPRYDLLADFFMEYDRQLSSSAGKQSNNGYCSIVNLLTGIIRSEKDTWQMLQDARRSDEPLQKWYFEGLNSEI
jgi:HD superfamily phosphodiesterase